MPAGFERFKSALLCRERDRVPLFGMGIAANVMYSI